MLGSRELAVLVFGLVAAGVTTQGSGAGAQDREGLIAFYSNRDGNYKIYSIRPDGSDLKRLTFDPASDQTPAWSPDGRRLAFTSERSGGGDLYVMDADGGSLRRLSMGPGDDSQPAWSPDGTRIAFSSLRDENRDIYVVNDEPPLAARSPVQCKVLGIQLGLAPLLNSPSRRRWS